MIIILIVRPVLKKLCWGFQSNKNLDKEGRDLFFGGTKEGRD